ncbi:NAD(P)-binding Rossmann-like domain protein [Leptospira inadai serovar Lyme str. 10]|uniref:NAD(P)-binding Rossmann-like domain protein n=2 Tax=Leptospira inadai serovar Lyme TaxID=293084 RepID=V6HB29_9LEPT|nr:NAD(P)/FAD-dependent oxidoreductase [Leptospira inadai]EQA35733.1 NAD(P)-binding Rossmann-like domain protein [Leptospira inadai serovar Lyme str. 10]PNV76798.1 NAD(P)/FAD-dependent oxidoreductase [Leptospira inadai serovar Lyme]
MEIENSENRYDVIFIGSGMGSLTAASLLTQFAGKKVLILEKHFQPGGFTHEFQRKQGKFHWDVGIHYVGDMHEEGLCRKLSDKITKKGVRWKRMPDPFERLVFPSRTFDIYGDPARFKDDLILQFPEEQEAIERYLKDIKKITALFGKSMMLRLSPPSLEAFSDLLGDPTITTLKEYFDANFKNEELKGILAAQWGDHGLPPSKVAFAMHASLVQHYINGGYYPVGGAGKIFDSIEPIVKAGGGDVLSSVEVREVLIRDGKAIGVKTKALRGEGLERDFFAPVVISCAGAYPTYTKLIPESVPISFREKLKDFYDREKMTTSLCLYLGLSDSPAKLGFKGENYWIFSSHDHDKNFSERNDWINRSGEIPNLYVSFPSLKNPEAKSHTADVITFTDYENFVEWKSLPWKKRGEDYKVLKEKITSRILSTIESRFPGFSKLVEFSELSTPITNEHFTSHPDGAIYGLACVAERYDKEKCPWFDVRTPISGLFLTGADAGSPGIAGAMMAGLAAATAVVGSSALLKELRN